MEHTIDSLKREGNVKELVRIAMTADRQIGRKAAEALRETGSSEALEFFLESAKSKDFPIRNRGIYVLEWMKDKRAVDTLLEIFLDTSVWYNTRYLSLSGLFVWH